MKDHFERVLKQKTLNLFSQEWYEETVNDLLSQPSNIVGGYVYFVKPKKDDGNVKVGFSSDVIKRLRSFKTLFDSPIILIGYIYSSNYKKIEKEMHSFFEKRRVSGEWFKISTSEINDILEKYRGRYVGGEFLKSSFIDGDFYGGFRIHSQFKKKEIDIDFKRLPTDGFRFYNSELKNMLGVGVKNHSLRAIIKAIKHNCIVNNYDLKMGNSCSKRWLEITKKKEAQAPVV